MNKKAVQKMRLANRYQKEAFMELIPEEIRGNISNIEKELKEIGHFYAGHLIRGAAEAFMESEPEEGSNEADKAKRNKIKKVDIG